MSIRTTDETNVGAVLAHQKSLRDEAPPVAIIGAGATGLRAAEIAALGVLPSGVHLITPPNLDQLRECVGRSLHPLQFEPYGKTPRLFRECIITEKLDGTNAQILIARADEVPSDQIIERFDDLAILAGSRSKWITPGKQTDNYGFAQWVKTNAEELMKLGVGRHFGEWWGNGIQRNYGLKEKRFSLFNVSRWSEHFEDDPKNEAKNRPDCCHVVPGFWRGKFDTRDVENAIEALRVGGSWAVPGWTKPEGVIVFHTASRQVFKVLLENDDKAKGQVE